MHGENTVYTYAQKYNAHSVENSLTQTHASD